MLQCKSSDEVFSDPCVPGRGADSFKTHVSSDFKNEYNTGSNVLNGLVLISIGKSDESNSRNISRSL
jgi:hypothetical protein